MTGGFTRFARAGLAVLFCLFAAAAAACGFFYGWVLPLGFLAGLLLGCLAKRLPRIESPRLALAVVLAATVASGAAWLLLTRVSQVYDFARIYQTAVAIAEGTPIPDAEYQALFPHLPVYPFLLSLFFRVFGASQTLAQLVNLLFSLAIAAQLFLLGKRFFGAAGGLAAGLAWALPPSQFIILSIVGSELPHMAFLLLAMRLYFSAAEENRWGFAVVRWTAVGVATAVSGLLRPLAPVFLLGFVLCCIVFGTARPFLKKAAGIAAMVLVYCLVTAAGYVLCERVIEHPVAKNGFGWNLFVGANVSSNGGWNAEDYAVMTRRMDEGMDAPQIQALFFEDAKVRIGERLADGTALSLLAKKFINVWSRDSFMVYWLTESARDGSPLDINKTATLLRMLCDLAYGVLLGLCAVSLYRQFAAGGSFFVLPVTLLTGVVIVFLLLEANPRYHYAGTAMLCALVPGIYDTARKNKTE